MGRVQGPTPPGRPGPTFQGEDDLLDLSELNAALDRHHERVSASFLLALESALERMYKSQLESKYDVSESNATSGTATSLTVAPQFENPVRITSIIAYVGVPSTSNSFGMIELGLRDFIPVPAGQLTYLSGGWRLSNTDVRILSSVTNVSGVPGARATGVAAFLYLALFGNQIPKEGVRL